MLDSSHNGADVDCHSAVEMGEVEIGDGGSEGTGYASIVVEDVKAAM